MTDRGHGSTLMWVAMGKAMAATIVAKAVAAMAEATDAAVRAVVKAVADRGWRGLLWKGLRECQQWWSAVEARATRRSAVARVTEKAGAAETAAATVMAPAPARAPFSQCAILTSVDVLKRPENFRRVTYLCGADFLLCLRTLPFLLEREFCS